MKQILAIAAVYMLAHFLLLIVSGYWWDDATLWNGEEVIDEIFKQNGVLDGILVLDMENITCFESLKMCFYEGFNQEKFNELLNEKSKVAYYAVSSEESEKIRQDYADGKVDSEYMSNLVDEKASKLR